MPRRRLAPAPIGADAAHARTEYVCPLIAKVASARKGDPQMDWKLELVIRD
jgi:hypothetical protein